MKWSRPLTAILVISLSLLGTTATATASESDSTDTLSDNLAEVIDEGDAALRSVALVALGQYGTSEHQEVFDDHKSASGEPERLATAAGLVLAGDSAAMAFAAEQLLAASSTYEALRQFSVYLPQEQLSQLIAEALSDASASDRRDIFRFQAAQRGAIYEHLGNQLTNSDEQVRNTAREALVHTADKATLDILEGLSGHGDAAIRGQLLEFTDTLSKRSDLREAVVELLEAASRDDDDQLQRRAARQLVELGEARGAEVLIGALAGADSDDRVELLEFLLQHDIQAQFDQIRPLIEAVEAAEDEDRERERQLLYELAATNADDAFFNDLREKFSSTYFDERLVSVRSLGRTGRDDAFDLLLRGLGEGRTDIRRYSARGLGQLEKSEGLTHLRGALTSESDEDVRLEIIEAVSRIQDVQSAQVLRFLVTHNDPAVRMAVVKGLDTIDLPETTSALEHMLQDRDFDIQWRAFLTLLRVEPNQARPHIRSTLRNPPDTFANDIDPHSLTRSARQALYEPILTHDTNRVRSAGLEHAVAHRDVLLPVARELITSEGLDPNVRRNLVHLLIAERDEEDIETLIKVVSDFPSEPGAEVAAWYLRAHLTSDVKELFEELADEEDPSVMGLLATIALADEATD